jgi:glyoxylase-like metal-dependent hydrolase (beta-lactamase superfamily II)
MYFRILNDEHTGELSYLLADLSAREAVLIDPHGRDLPVLSALLAERDLRLRWVLRSHHHDALQPGEAALLARFGVPLVQGDVADCVANHRGPAGAVLPFGDELIHVVATPGHTRHCLSFAWRDRFFCGSLLAPATCPHQARAQVPQEMWDSVMQKVFTLADETLLFAGHGQCARAVSTVLEQRRWHPFFAGLTRDEFLAQMAVFSDHPPPTPFFED